MRLLTCAFVSAGEFLDCYSVGEPPPSADPGRGGLLFCRTRGSLAVGEILVVEITFPGMPNPTLLRGEVVAQEQGTGLWVQLHGGDGHSLDFLLGLARGDLSATDPVERGHRRIPVALPVSCRVEEVDEPESPSFDGQTHDVGGGGVFVQAEAPPAVGTRVSLVLGPTPGSGELFSIDGRVAWIRRDTRARGFGVRFDPKGSDDSRRLRAMVRRAWESGRVQFAEDPHLVVG